jgi:O-succinylbenzoate synthase
VLPRFRVEVDAGAVVRPKLSIILHMKDGLKVRVHKREEDGLA